ncbi:hypothetical protein AVEN_68034-1 [Araneus ventricosus]|uniref:Uncharacterized protein n=1 Tax=Araneus ventricosus TaxID=182803 RepID=A0A4Y2MAL1_ARAVE|nr:hypothetical protein AVEN_68034-1 [Araneus ventricosus]
MPNPAEGESPAKDLDTPTTSVRSQRIPTQSLSKVAEVSSIELLINEIIDFNLDLDVSENVISLLQELSKIYVNKSRDITKDFDFHQGHSEYLQSRAFISSTKNRPWN